MTFVSTAYAQYIIPESINYYEWLADDETVKANGHDLASYLHFTETLLERFIRVSGTTEHS
eukprot:594411-Amphidinium_carterae.1